MNHIHNLGLNIIGAQQCMVIVLDTHVVEFSRPYTELVATYENICVSLIKQILLPRLIISVCGQVYCSKLTTGSRYGQES